MSDHNETRTCTAKDHEAFGWFEGAAYRPHLIVCSKCGKTQDMEAAQ